MSILSPPLEANSPSHKPCTKTPEPSERTSDTDSDQCIHFTKHTSGAYGGGGDRGGVEQVPFFGGKLYTFPK